MSSILNNSVLVLNKSWYPIDSHSMRKALRSVVANRSRILCPVTYQLHDFPSWIERGILDGEDIIRGFGQMLCAPEVIITRYDKVPKRIVQFNRRNLWRRDQHYCQYCGKKPPADEISIDHVVPKSQGGLTVFENTVLACVECNKRKDDRTPEQARMPLVKRVKSPDGSIKLVPYHRPVRPQWSPIYVARRQRIPESWSKFLQHIVDELYWSSELEP